MFSKYISISANLLLLPKQQEWRESYTERKTERERQLEWELERDRIRQQHICYKNSWQKLLTSQCCVCVCGKRNSMTVLVMK